MDIIKIIETQGFIIKEETVVTVENGIIPETFVLESIDPFPGFRVQESEYKSVEPMHLFFVTKQSYHTEHLLRTTEHIKKFFAHDFIMDIAELTIFNDVCFALRIKNLPNYNLIQELQNWYKDEGIIFEKKRKIEANIISKVRKFVLIDQLSEFIYKDKEEPNIHYFEIPKQLHWMMFVKLTNLVRSSFDYTYNFDAAIGGIFRNTGVVDVIRIYSKNFPTEKILNVRKKYIELIQRFDNKK